MFFITEIRRKFMKEEKEKTKLVNCKKFPNHIAIVIDNYEQKYHNQLKDAVRFLKEIKEIKIISLFFTANKKCNLENLKLPENVNVYFEENVKKDFHKLMSDKTEINGTHYPFPAPVDFVVIYSNVPNLCGFYTWTLDLSTLFFSGTIRNLSEESLVNALHDFENSVQRYGK